MAALLITVLVFAYLVSVQKAGLTLNPREGLTKQNAC